MRSVFTFGEGNTTFHPKYTILIFVISPSPFLSCFLFQAEIFSCNKIKDNDKEDGCFYFRYFSSYFIFFCKFFYRVNHPLQGQNAYYFSAFSYYIEGPVSVFKKFPIYHRPVLSFLFFKKVSVHLFSKAMSDCCTCF